MLPKQALNIALILAFAILTGCEADDRSLNGDQPVVDGDVDDIDDEVSGDEEAQVGDDYRDVRGVQSLNGIWELEQGSLSDTPPDMYRHTVSVPALVSAATPRFEEVGLKSERREAFWYRRSFSVEAPPDRVQLVIHKAKYGVKVWLNGRELGEHFGSYTAKRFDITGAVHASDLNDLVVRVGAWLDAVPEEVPAGQDPEKMYWIPGLYDDVEIISSSTPHIVHTKIEPDIDQHEVRIVTRIRNDSDSRKDVQVRSFAVEWSGGARASDTVDTHHLLEPGQEAEIIQLAALESPHLWSPEDPFLYAMRTWLVVDSEVSDNLETRFGMRKVEWRSGPDLQGKFMLNNRPYYLRGSNLTLHRFFEDSIADGNVLAWDRLWVRELLTTTPKSLHWNSFRVCVGRAPRFWYDLFDELGYIIADEFMMWTVMDNSAKTWSLDEMEKEYTSWIQDNWNHPSISWWDASNETQDRKSYDSIDRLRHLDPTRQWENGGYGEPHGENDPIEDHPYLFIPLFSDLNTDLHEVLDENDGRPPQGGLVGTSLGTWQDSSHPYLINEYGYVWINRDGTPTALSEQFYETFLGPGVHDPETYREAYAYIVGGLTGFWRARRHYAGIQHFAYLGYSRPGGDTSDNFIDVQNLVLEPRWRAYAESAFSPIMIYIDSWRQDYTAEEIQTVPVVVINDLDTEESATLRMRLLTKEGEVLWESEPLDVTIDALGVKTMNVEVAFPQQSKLMLVAELELLYPGLDRVYSVRKIGYDHIGETGPWPVLQQ